MKINEIFCSIQGEGTRSGLRTVFVRLTGCNLRCSYCDTKYAYKKGKEMPVNEIVKEVKSFNCKHICITGGEPYLQLKEVNELIDKFIPSFTWNTFDDDIIIETNGSHNIFNFHIYATNIMDYKLPSSGMSHKMDNLNLERLRANDEIKFVIGTREDYELAKTILKKTQAIPIFSSVHNKLSIKTLASWILKDKLDVRLQTQLHKLIWGDKKSV